MHRVGDSHRAARPGVYSHALRRDQRTHPCRVRPVFAPAQLQILRRAARNHASEAIMTATESSVPAAISPPSGEFSAEQKEYFSGFMAGIAQRGLFPYV